MICQVFLQLQLYCIFYTVGPERRNYVQYDVLPAEQRIPGGPLSVCSQAHKSYLHIYPDTRVLFPSPVARGHAQTKV